MYVKCGFRELIRREKLQAPRRFRNALEEVSVSEFCTKKNCEGTLGSH
jgi:hypothetical protein